MGGTSRVKSTNLFVLEATKEYLLSRLERQVPDSLLANAWDEFYDVYNELILRYVVAQGVEQSNVDDCVQEVWREVAKRLVQFERPPGRPGLRSWLYAIVRSKVTDLVRKRRTQNAGGLDEQIAGEEPECPLAAEEERKWERALLESLLQDLRGELSERSVKVVEMRVFEGRGVADVAAALGLSPEQVRARHYRAMKKLRTRVALYTGEPIGASD